METKSDLFEAILKWSPPEVEAWLDEHSIGEPVRGESFNWDVFAFTAAARAREERSLSWARIALRVYENLVDCSTDRSARSFLFSAMNLRAWMIRELGVREGDAVLDPEAIVAWFLQSASLPIEEALELVSPLDLRAIPQEKLLALRDIKNALNVIALLSGTGVAEKHPELANWLRIRRDLP
jgi:hypothetical protein